MTIADWGSVVIAAVILVNSSLRFAKGAPNVRLLCASLAMIIPLMGSISVIFDWADPLVGGRSYINLLTHLIMIYSEWSVARATDETLQAIAHKRHRPLLLRGWVPLVALVGTVATFLWLSPAESSRGLSEYGTHPAYVAYWGFTILPLLLPAFNLVPRIWRGRHVLGIPRAVRSALGLLMISFAGSVVLQLAFIGAAVFPELSSPRDILSTVVLLMFALSLLLATAALPPAGERPGRPSPPKSSRGSRLQPDGAPGIRATK